jgi:hypothetical protein
VWARVVLGSLRVLISRAKKQKKRKGKIYVLVGRHIFSIKASYFVTIMLDGGSGVWAWGESGKSIYINTHNCEMMRAAEEGAGNFSEILSFRSVFFGAGGGMGWVVWGFMCFIFYEMFWFGWFELREIHC